MENRVWNLMETNTMIRGSNWEDGKSTIRAAVFGKMVELCRDRVKYYRSDLYHDALWINERLVGPMQFDWVCRESGTFIGDVVSSVKDDQWEDSARYRFEVLVEKDTKWILNIYEATTLSMAQEAVITWEGRHAALDVRDCDMAASAAGCIYHPAPVNGFPPAGCTGYNTSWGTIQHDGETCLVHENDPLDVSCIGYFNGEGILTHETDCPVHGKANTLVGWTVDQLLEGPRIPLLEENSTLRNNPVVENIRKENGMYGGSTVDTIREALEEKLQELNDKLEELDNLESELEDAKSIAQRNIDSVEEALNSLDLDLEDFSFEADVNFSN